MTVDTSDEAVKSLAAVLRNMGPLLSHTELERASATLRALAAERAALRARVAEMEAASDG